MKLFAEFGFFLSWMWQLGAAFFRTCAGITTALVCASVVNRVTSILAFVLPLKVITVLASSSRMNSVENLLNTGANTLAAALIAAVVVALFASVFTNRLIERLSATGGHAVLTSANEIAFVKDPLTTAQTIYRDFCTIVAEVCFIGIGVLGIGYLTPTVMLVLGPAVVLEFGITAIGLKTARAVQPNRAARFIKQNMREYLDILASVNMFLALVALLVPLVLGESAAVVNALLSFVVLRRVLRTAAGTVNRSVKLANRRDVASALFFKDRSYREGEGRSAESFRELFDKSIREARLAEALKRQCGAEFHTLSVSWHDAKLPGMYRMRVETFRNGTRHARFQQQIYMPKQQYRLDNEVTLFQYVSREALAAPRVAARYAEGPFHCQLCAIAVADDSAPRPWREVHDALVQKHMALCLPQALVKAYAMSHPLLAERLGDEFVGRLSLAADSAEEQHALRELRARLPRFREALAVLPLFIHNPELQFDNVESNEQGQPVVMTWGKWRVEPIGATSPPTMNNDATEQIVESLRAARPDVGPNYHVDQFKLARDAGALERQINAAMYKKGLETCHRLLGNPVLASEDSAAAATF